MLDEKQIEKMSEYIDMDEYISKTELLKVINADIAEAHNERCVQLLNAILYAPTADVVPKSEVDMLQAEINAYSIAKKYDAEHFMADIKKLQMENATIIKNRDKLLQSYARKIFEEIERIIGGKYNHYVFGNNDLDSIEQDAIINFSDSLSECFAELKKKYTDS